MTRKEARISVRKAPRQARSRQLVADVLEAAIRVLEAGGAARFTMARVAEKAGVSVGSLYQYFANKEAILFQLQAREWEENVAFLASILADQAQPPEARLKEMTRQFFKSEVEEAAVRGALAAAAPLYGDAPEARAHKARARRIMLDFLGEALPGAAADRLAFTADLVSTTLSAVGKTLSEEDRSLAEVDRMAQACAHMLWAWMTGAGEGNQTP